MKKLVRVVWQRRGGLLSFSSGLKWLISWVSPALPRIPWGTKGPNCLILFSYTLILWRIIKPSMQPKGLVTNDVSWVIADCPFGTILPISSKQKLFSLAYRHGFFFNIFIFGLFFFLPFVSSFAKKTSLHFSWVLSLALHSWLVKLQPMTVNLLWFSSDDSPMACHQNLLQHWF